MEFEVALSIDGTEVLRETLTGDELEASALRHAQLTSQAVEDGREWRMTITDKEGDLPPLVMGSDDTGMRKPVPIRSGAEAIAVYDGVAMGWDPLRKTWRD